MVTTNESNFPDRVKSVNVEENKPMETGFLQSANLTYIDTCLLACIRNIGGGIKSGDFIGLKMRLKLMQSNNQP